MIHSLRTRPRTVILFLICFLVVPGPLSAAMADEGGEVRTQGAAPGGASSIENATTAQELRNKTIEELMEIEVDTVVSASRYRQRVSEAPSSVTIITADDIRKFGYRTLADILRSVRGFTTTYDRNYAYVGVRGFGRLGDYNTRILLLVDGHRINDTIYDSASIGTDFILDVDLIERVEVSRGPGSSLYGSNAFFGVVNIITRKVKEGKEKEASVEAASYDTYKARLTFGSADANGRSVLASLSGFGSGGNRLYFHEFDQRNPFADLRARNDGYADDCDYDRYRSGYARFENRSFAFAAAYIERTKGIPTASYGTDFNDPGNRTLDQRGYVDLQYTERSAGGTELAVRTYYDLYRYEGDYHYSGILNKDRAESSWYGVEARITSRVLNIHHVVAGAEFEDRIHQDQWNADVNPSVLYLDDHHSSRSWAVYVQDEVTISPIFLLYAGIRHDAVSIFGNMTNPRLGAVISPVKNGTLKLLYGRAFRAPTVYELYYEAPPSTVNNPDLQPERIETYELVYEQDLGNGLRATVSQYSYAIRNLITQTYDVASGTTSYENLERAEATGTELEIRKTWPNGIDGRFNFSYQRTENPTTGEQLTNSPKELAKLNVSVPVVRERFWTSVEEQYTGPRTTLAGKRIGGFSVMNLALFARVPERALEFSFDIYNVLNKRYSDPVSSDLFPLDTVQQDGRTYRVKLTYAF